MLHNLDHFIAPFKKKKKPFTLQKMFEFAAQKVEANKGETVLLYRISVSSFFVMRNKDWQTTQTLILLTL